METEVRHSARRTGLAALVAGVLLCVSVAAELVYKVQKRDGTVVETELFALYSIVWVLGAAALTLAVWGLRRPTHPGRVRGSRGHRSGWWTSLAGAALLLAWGIVFLITGLVNGKPLEASFLLFGLGFLLTVIGNVTLGFSLRQSTLLGSRWPLLVIAGAGALLAVVVFVDPWHDVGMFTFDAAWAAIGVSLLAGNRS